MGGCIYLLASPGAGYKDGGKPSSNRYRRCEMLSHGADAISVNVVPFNGRWSLIATSAHSCVLVRLLERLHFSSLALAVYFLPGGSIYMRGSAHHRVPIPPSPCQDLTRTVCVHRKLRCLNSCHQATTTFLIHFYQAGPGSGGTRNPHFLLFATDADRELKVPIRDAAAYRTLPEGWPARLRKCKVMIRVFNHAHWFLVTTRHSHDGAQNRSIRESLGFSWNGPLTVMRLEKRGDKIPAGILSSEHYQAASAAVEWFVIQLTM